jgi:hypothetical protein
LWLPEPVVSVSVTLFDRSVPAMNPYEANLSNTVARLGAWVRGIVRLYRQPLLALAAAGAVMAIGVGATRAPAQPPLAAVTAETPRAR